MLYFSHYCFLFLIIVVFFWLLLLYFSLSLLHFFLIIVVLFPYYFCIFSLIFLFFSLIIVIFFLMIVALPSRWILWNLLRILNTSIKYSWFACCLHCCMAFRYHSSWLEKGVSCPYLESKRGPSGLQLPWDNAAQHTRQGARPSVTDVNSQSLAEISEIWTFRVHTW